MTKKVYRRRKTDKNQKEMIGVLRNLGFSVISLHEVGNGVPDLAVGIHGHTFLVEVKSPKENVLTEKQKDFRETWRGGVYEVQTFDDCVNLKKASEVLGRSAKDKYIQLQEQQKLERIAAIARANERKEKPNRTKARVVKTFNVLKEHDKYLNNAD